LKLKVFTLRFSGSTEAFDDGPLQEFIADKEVIEYSEHFFIHENKPCLTILLAYRELESLESRRVARRADVRLELDAPEKEAYDALRSWRAATAKMEGIPPYMIVNNKQLAKMVKIRPTSREALGRVEGIGEAKTAKYGDQILEVISKHLTGIPIHAGERKGEPGT
jgi:superfamily II DNA helicase RecQ